MRFSRSRSLFVPLALMFGLGSLTATARPRSEPTTTPRSVPPRKLIARSQLPDGSAELWSWVIPGKPRFSAPRLVKKERLLVSVRRAYVPKGDHTLVRQLVIRRPHRRNYSSRELSRLYRLQNLDAQLVTQVLPALPRAYPLRLKPQTDPVLSKPVGKLSQGEIDSIVRTTAEKVNAFWAREFNKRGGVYTPVPIYSHAPKPGEDRGSRFVDGVVYIDPLEVRAAGAECGLADASIIQLTVAHEIAHHVAAATGIKQRAMETAVNDYYGGGHLKTRRLRDRPEVPLQVHVERQAQYLAGLSLRETGLLRRGDPQTLYFMSVTHGDDYARVANKIPPMFPKPLDPAFFRDHADHGRGKQLARSVYEGMLPTSTVDKGLTWLGTQPVFPAARRVE